jgi:hypothetical protein
MKLVALAAMGLALAGGVAAASSQADPVTFAMRQYVNENKTRVYVWYGQIASGAAGEDVEVLGRDCLTKDFRLYAGTKSVAGGAWEVDSVAAAPPYGYFELKSGTALLARWRGQWSNTITYRIPIQAFYPLKVPKKRAWRIIVNPTPLYMKLGGKPVVLQRLRAGKWERFQSAPLVLKANYDYGGATNYEAVFKIPTRGLQVRALLATKVVAPCYFGRTTAPWRT